MYIFTLYVLHISKNTVMHLISNVCYINKAHYVILFKSMVVQILDNNIQCNIEASYCVLNLTCFEIIAFVGASKV